MENAGVLAGGRRGRRRGNHTDPGRNIDPLICSVYCVYKVKMQIIDNFRYRSVYGVQ